VKSKRAAAQCPNDSSGKAFGINSCPYNRLINPPACNFTARETSLRRRFSSVARRTKFASPAECDTVLPRHRFAPRPLPAGIWSRFAVPPNLPPYGGGYSLRIGNLFVTIDHYSRLQCLEWSSLPSSWGRLPTLNVFPRVGQSSLDRISGATVTQSVNKFHLSSLPSESMKPPRVELRKTVLLASLRSAVRAATSVLDARRSFRIYAAETEHRRAKLVGPPRVERRHFAPLHFARDELRTRFAHPTSLAPLARRHSPA
jgi:hypothetical protein